MRFGLKLTEWEVKGVPVALMIGISEMDGREITAKRRDSGEETSFGVANVSSKCSELLDTIQVDLLARSTKVKEENTRDVKDYDEFKRVLKEHKGFVRVFWNDDSVIEKKIKEETMAVSRCMIEESDQEGVDFYTGEASKTVWLFAQAY